MARETMYMLNVVGKIEFVDAFASDILQIHAISPVDVMQQIDDTSFTIRADEENIEKTLDFNNVIPFGKDESLEALTQQAKLIVDYFNVKPNNKTSKMLSKDELAKVYNNLAKEINNKKIAQDKVEQMETDIQNVKFLQSNNFELLALQGLKNFTFRYGSLIAEGRLKLKKNYENNPAVFIHLGSKSKEEIYLAIYPSQIDEEINRILKSFGWVDIELPKVDTNNENVLRTLESDLLKAKEEIESNNINLDKILNENTYDIQNFIYSVNMYKTIEHLKSYMARSSKFYYMAGWIPESKLEKVKAALKKYPHATLRFKKADEVIYSPPTLLKNNFLYRPFEGLVRMYGTPNYNEIDPTAFFAITYTILFGMMFGDVGQGLIFALVGLLILKKHRTIGGVLLRVGISSTIFGFLYGSIFGDEHIIKPLLINPFENITTVLIAAICFGVLLSSCAYILGIYNKLFKQKDIEDGLFGKDGLAGFVLYLSFIFVALNIIKISVVPNSIATLMLLISILLILFKQPLARLIEKIKPLHKEGAGAYYLESSFSLIEALLGVFSSLVSFIRVGAFAINHVGLFMAFQTMAKMTSGTASVAILIFGNILIIGLEGLIVAIQGLRLEYYELFSKYYTGDGKDFMAIGKKETSF